MDPKDRRARGLAVYQAMGWGENAAVKELDEDLWQLTTDVLFGEIWSRPGLSLRERELVTLAALMAAKADGIALHMRNAHNLGISFDEMKRSSCRRRSISGCRKRCSPCASSRR
jgi:4-carboxymuconolactone decarboxylase